METLQRMRQGAADRCGDMNAKHVQYSIVVWNKARQNIDASCTESDAADPLW